MKNATWILVRLVSFMGAILWAPACGDPTEPNQVPGAVGSIPARSVFVADTVEIVVSGYFNDPDGDALSYSAQSSDATVASTAASADSVRVIGLKQGSATVTVTATDPGGLSATQSFSVTVPNRAPEAADSIPAVETYVEKSAPVVVAAYFRDPDGDVLSYSAESSDEGVATATVSGDTVVVAGTRRGTATVTVTAIDPGGLSATRSLSVTVANSAPEAVDSIPALKTHIGESTAVVVPAYFRDPDGDSLSYAVESSDTAVATATVSGDTVRVVAVAQGIAIATVTASDPEGLFVEQSFPVNVLNRAPEVVDSIPAAGMGAGDQTTVIVSGYFSDPDGDSLSYEAESSDTAVVAVSVSGDKVQVAGVAEGSATVTVTASDPGGLSVGQAFPVKVSPDRQPAILEAFFEATGGADWTNNDNWLTDAPLDTWHGVEVNGRGRVISLELFRNNLKGTIPGELGGLSSLETLDVRSNGLSGPIPPEFGNLTNLVRAYMDTNELTGPIPPELGDLPRLKYLWLLGNSLSGPIPPEIGKLSGLSGLSLSFNRLTGSIPPEMGDLHNLEFMDLSINRLTGGIPPEMGDLQNLKTLNLRANQLTGGIPPELGDAQNLKTLNLSDNLLTGSMTPQLGSLDSLSELRVEYNQLEGRLPATFFALGKLHTFRFQFNTSLCFPRTSGFVAWRRNLRSVEGPWCGEADRKVLEALYEAAEGDNWENSGGWLVGDDLDTWYGVRADSFGYVVEIDLEDNGLKGKIPFEVGDLEALTKLEIGTNDLVGPLPLRLVNLSLERFGYADTKLCELDDEEFEEWLDGIPSLERTREECPDPREVLTALYHATGGSGWWYNENWLSDAPLDEWYGIETDEDGQVTRIELTDNLLVSRLPPELGDLPRLELLSLFKNYLSGPIPPELGKLSSLLLLFLSGNRLTGSIPPELGNLHNLHQLHLMENQLTGRIPPELGDLHKLRGLHLFENQLSGSIPSELGRLSNLVDLSVIDNELTGAIPSALGELPNLRNLHLDQNELTGAIPRELGDLSSLVRLSLTNNDLSGSIPTSLGRLWRLHRLEVSHNPKLAGTIPSSLTNLTELWTFYTAGTGLCGPDDSTFLDWLNGIMLSRVKICGRENLAAYLIQSTQSREYPVPLVAEKQALLRVFVTATRKTDEEIPPVRARFYRDGSETYTVTIPGKSVVIPTEIDEGSLEKSSNVTIPDTVLHPGLEMVVEIDPEDTLDDDLLVTRRIPEEGRLALEVHSMPDFELTFVPFLWEEDPDSSVLEATGAMADDEEEHELLHDTYDLLPVEGLSVSEHDPVVSSSNVHVHLLHQTYAIRAMEGGSGYWMGLMAGLVLGGRGVALLANKVSFSVLDSWVMAHELGHNLYSRHAPGCGTRRNTVDRNYPYLDGRIGAWGYDHRTKKVLRPSTRDFMTYCDPRWVSDYFFSNMTRWRANGAVIPEEPGFDHRGLLVWGGVDDEGVPSLEPAVVVDAPLSGPRGPGPYTLTGTDAAGARLFSFSFDMEEVADAEGEAAQFAFILRVEPGWEGSLASISLTAPDGSVTLDGATDAPMAIVRDVRSGQVRAFLRGLSQRPRLPSGFEVYWSRGIPGREAWKR